MDQSVAVSEPRPPRRKLVDFPLVAMLIGIFVYLAALALGIALGNLFEAMVQPERAILRAVTNIALVVAVYKAIIARLGEHPRDDLRPHAALVRLGQGLCVGLLAFSAAVGVAALIGVYQVTGFGDSSRLVLELVASAVMPAFMEELLFRGILFRWIEEFGGSWAALLLSSLIFGAAHLGNPSASWFTSFGIAIGPGLLLGAAYMLTRNLWLSMGIHAAWNFAQGEIFDVPVSGIPAHGLLTARLSGSPLMTGNGFGLEGSAIGITTGIIFGLVFLWLAIRRGELVRPMWLRRRTRD